MFDPQTLWEGLVCDPLINRDGRAWEVGPLDYHNYCNYDSSYKYGHPMSVMEKVAVHIHGLNKKVANDPPSYCNHSTTNGFGPYNSHETVTLKGACSYAFTKKCPQSYLHYFCLKARCYFFFFIEFSLLLNSRLLSHCRPVQKCISFCYGFDR